MRSAARRPEERASSPTSPPGSPSRCSSNWGCGRASPASSAAIRWRERKPHPLPLLHAAELAGVAPGECIYVGDAERDVQAAHAAGMPALVANYGYLRADEDSSRWGGDALSRAGRWICWTGSTASGAPMSGIGAHGWHCAGWRIRAPWPRCCGARAASRRCASRLEVLRARLKTEESSERGTRAGRGARPRANARRVRRTGARQPARATARCSCSWRANAWRASSRTPAQALKERETAIETLVQPIREALAKTEAQIQAIERDRIDSFADASRPRWSCSASGQNLLSRETRNLVTALRRPDVRGQWGEITLRRLVELSGMTSHVDFTEQQHRSTDSGAIRPGHGRAHAGAARHRGRREDAARRLSRRRSRRRATRSAAAQLRRHAQIVGARDPRAGLEAVLGAVRAQPGFRRAVPAREISSCRRRCRKIPALIDESLRQNVMLATPTSLVALLKSGRLRLETDGARRQCRRDARSSARICTSGWRCSASTSASSASRWAAASIHSTGPWARSSSKYCPPRGASRVLGLRVNREIELIEPVESLARMPRADTAARADAPGEAGF